MTETAGQRPGDDPEFDIDVREARIIGKPPRIAPLTPEEFDGEAKALVVDIRETLGVTDEIGQIPEVFAIMLKHPALFRCQMDIGIELLGRGALSRRERELAILRVGWLCRAPYEWGEHVDIAKRYGVTEEEIERVTQGSSAPGWSEHDRAIIQGVEELLDDKMISDQTWNLLARTWSERQLLEFPVLVGQYFLTAIQQNSLRIRLGEDNIGLRQR